MTERVALPHYDLPRLDLHLWMVALLFFGIGDAATTIVGLNIEGIAEMSPVLAPFVRENHFVAILVAKSLLFALCYLIWRSIPGRHRIGVPLGLALVGVFVTGWNIGILLLATSP